VALPSPRWPCAVDSTAGVRISASAAQPATGGTILISPKTKRVTIPVSATIDVIRDRLKHDTGITMSYAQIFNFLIHFYVERANEPKSKWKTLA
jgi:hypothetical protein